MIIAYPVIIALENDLTGPTYRDPAVSLRVNAREAPIAAGAPA